MIYYNKEVIIFMNTKYFKIKQLIIVLGLFTLSLMLSSCNYYRYDNSEKYIAGDAIINEEIKHCYIEWVSGEVNIIYHDQDYIAFSETANRDLSSKEVVRYWQNGAILNLRFAEAGRQNFNNLHKVLTILMPSTMTLQTLDIETISANVKVENIEGNILDVETVSGNIKLNEVNFRDNNLSSVSGKIEGELKQSEELDVETVSGDIDLFSSYTKEFDIETVSGAIELSLNNGQIYGDPDWRGDIETVSGNVEVRLLENTEFVLYLKTTSGIYTNDFPCEKHPSHYLHISSKNSIHINTVSGNINILEFSENNN